MFQSYRTRPKKSGDDGLDWKHDKYEEIIANEPEHSRKEYKQKPDSRMERKTPKKLSRDEINSGKVGRNTPSSAAKPPRGPPAQPATESTPRKSEQYRETTQTSGTGSKGNKEGYHTSSDKHTPNSSRKLTYNKDYSTKEPQHTTEHSKEATHSKEYTKKTPTKGPLGQLHKNTAESAHSTSKVDYATKVSAIKSTSGSTAKATQSTVATKSTPVKPPPGLDSAVLNPGARAFQPTDDAARHSPSPTPSGTPSNSSAGRGKWKYGADPASYSYTTDGVAPPVIAAYVAVSTAPVQQTVTFRGVNAPESPAIPAASTIPSTPVPPTQQQVSYKEHSPLIKYPSAGTTHQTPPPAVQHPRPTDFHSAGRPARSPAAATHNPTAVDPSADMYGMGIPMPQHSGMMYRGSYMSMPMYDPQQMMYMSDPSMMQGMAMGRGMSHHSMGHHPHMHSHHAGGGEYGDGTVWYSNMPTQSMGGMAGIPSADGTAVSGGTVYYPLPPSAPTRE